MGILSGLFRTRDGPKNATSGSTYSFFMGTSAAGKSVNERSAMQMTAVYACVRILSESIAGLPLHMYQYEEDGSKKKAVEHPLYHLLHDEPNPEMTSFIFRETLMSHLLLWGNAYAQIIRNGKGDIIALYGDTKQFPGIDGFPQDLQNVVRQVSLIDDGDIHFFKIFSLYRMVYDPTTDFFVKNKESKQGTERL